MKNINLDLDSFADVKELVVREGQAAPIDPPSRIMISGDINTVAMFLNRRYFENNDVPAPELQTEQGRQFVNNDRAVITINKVNRSILLETDPEEKYGTTVIAKMEISEEVKKYGINEPNRTYSRKQLIQLLKFTRLYFVDPIKHGELLSGLEKLNLETHINTKDESDDRANKVKSIEKKVKTDLPEYFILNVPIYKGEPKEKFRVMINFDVTESSVAFWFESVELNDLLELRRDEKFSTMTEKWKDFVIVYE
jgi:hypothetical protein